MSTRYTNTNNFINAIIYEIQHILWKENGHTELIQDQTTTMDLKFYHLNILRTLGLITRTTPSTYGAAYVHNGVTYMIMPTIKLQWMKYLDVTFLNIRKMLKKYLIEEDYERFVKHMHNPPAKKSRRKKKR